MSEIYVCNSCAYKWIHGSIQPCRSCKHCRGFGGTEDNYEYYEEQ